MVVVESSWCVCKRGRLVGSQTHQQETVRAHFLFVCLNTRELLYACDYTGMTQTLKRTHPVTATCTLVPGPPSAAVSRWPTAPSPPVSAPAARPTSPPSPPAVPRALGWFSAPDPAPRVAARSERVPPARPRIDTGGAVNVCK